MMSPAILLPLSLLLLSLPSPSLSSVGDKSVLYLSCNGYCLDTNCSSAGVSYWTSHQPPLESLLGWTCQDDCRYVCMWFTVGQFLAAGRRVPQFHGKWPFVRMWGVQEPLAALFSVLNLAANVYMLRWMVKAVPPDAPMFKVWVMYSLTSINAWSWSTIFHTRDNSFTEMMDYFCAFSMVLFSLLAYLLRQAGPDFNYYSLFLCSIFSLLFLHHVYMMALVKFDYGYNMKVNITVGAANCLAWLGWCYFHWGEGLYVTQGTAAVLLLFVTALLEVLDFPPWFWMLDSHALWHLCTAPLPLLWYRFIAGDCLELLRQKEIKMKIV